MKLIHLILVSFFLLSACRYVPFAPPTEPPIAQPEPRILEPVPLPPVPAGQNGTPTACTMEYRPVCGKVDIVCITTPCDPIDQTFGNECMAKASNAYDIREGECPNQQ